MNGWVMIGIGLFVWIVVSQLIAWMITPSQDPDEVHEAWFVVFLLPAVLLVALVMMADENFYRFLRQLGITWRL